MARLLLGMRSMRIADATEVGVGLVIAERGSAWEPWAAHLQARGLAVVTVRQGPLEGAPAFAQRVRAQVAQLEARAQLIEQAVLVGGRRLGPEALPARSLVIRAVASHMAHASGGELLLEGDGLARFSMRALAETVSGMVRGTGVSVRHAEAAPALAQVA